MRIGCFLLVLSFFSCRSTQVQSPTLIAAQQLELTKLSAKNLSERLTNDDEILLGVFLVERTEEDVIIQQTHFYPTFRFVGISTQTLTPQVFQFEAKDQEQYYVFTLVELDEENSVSKVQQKLTTMIQQGEWIKKVDFVEMNRQLDDDDFLGLQYLARTDLYQERHLQLVFQGRHLLDRYEYVLSGIGR